jgi:putative glutamine amidotransferase
MNIALRPLIGVTGPARGGHSGWSFSWLALRRMGARVRRLRPPLRQALLDELDGVVIGGGAHVEPSRYAQQPSIEYVYDEQRDEFEWAVLGSVMERRLPLLGICRGAQLINVFRGGTLYQNLPEDIPGIHLKRHVLARKRIELVNDTLLARVMGVHNVRVNSLHRQGVRELGEGLRVSARDEWGIVQAIETGERGGPFLLGVQWHPEYLPAHPAHRRLFRELVVAAAGPAPR